MPAEVNTDAELTCTQTWVARLAKPWFYVTRPYANISRRFLHWKSSITQHDFHPWRKKGFQIMNDTEQWSVWTQLLSVDRASVNLIPSVNLAQRQSASPVLANRKPIWYGPLASVCWCLHILKITAFFALASSSIFTYSL